MFDVIGKRRWFYLASLILTIPGLVFILLTPFTDAGLQFTIDYTGGTKWEIRFEDPTVTPEQVEAVFAEQGLEASAITTGDRASSRSRPSRSGSRRRRRRPRRRPWRRRPAQARPAARARPPVRRLGQPGRVDEPRPEREPSPSPSPSPAPSASAAASASAGASASPSASPSVAPVGNTELPTTGQLGAVREALETELGPIAQQNTLTTIGAVVSSDLISQALVLIAVGSIGILLWITYRFRDVKFGVTALISLLHDVIAGRWARSRSSARSSASRSTRCS